MSTNPDILCSAEPRRWMAYHVFYGSAPTVLLRDCLLPLSQDLHERGLIRRSFYINYWLEGGHVRLRLDPAARAEEDAIDAEVTETVTDYLRRRPSMHPMARIEQGSYYRKMFDLEYSEEERGRYFREDGTAILQSNNTVVRREYEPEWDRYGGPVGMVISEDFFADSTQLAGTVIDLGNTSTRTILLGLGAEIMAVTAAALLSDHAALAAFLQFYHSHWAGSYGSSVTYTQKTDQPRFRKTVSLLQRSVVPMIDAVLAGAHEDLPGFLGDWARTCITYRRRIEEAVSERALVFRHRDGAENRPDNVSEAAWNLCHSYVHMTSNRLMISIEDEAYLAFEILQALSPRLMETAA